MIPNHSSPPEHGNSIDADTSECAIGHIRLGWWSLLVFLSLGIVLEGLHAFKTGWYLNVGSETRRLLLTLAHAHGTLLALVNIAFGVSLLTIQTWPTVWRTVASRCLTSAAVLLPGGFLLGGVFFYDNKGDPGLGILLVPIGAIMLLVAVLLVACRMSQRTPQ